MKVFLYARVSTRDQDEQLQLPILRRTAAERGWEVVGEYSDEASGRDANRPGWTSLKGDIGLVHPDAVLVVKLDRMIRSLKGFLHELEVFRRYGVRVVSLDYGDLDPRDPTGQLVIRFMASLAEWEREIISERTKAALAEKKRKGVRLGRPESEIPVHRIALMRTQGMSWKAISEAVGVPRSTIMGRRDEIEAEAEKAARRRRDEFADPEGGRALRPASEHPRGRIRRVRVKGCRKREGSPEGPLFIFSVGCRETGAFSVTIWPGIRRCNASRRPLI